MQTIKTTYLPATNTRGARIKASASAGSLIIPYPHDLDTEAGHALAAVTFAKEKNWSGELVSGSDENHYYFNFANSSKYSVK